MTKNYQYIKHNTYKEGTSWDQTGNIIGSGHDLYTYNHWISQAYIWNIWQGLEEKVSFCMVATWQTFLCFINSKFCYNN